MSRATMFRSNIMVVASSKTRIGKWCWMVRGMECMEYADNYESPFRNARNYIRHNQASVYAPEDYYSAWSVAA